MELTYDLIAKRIDHSLLGPTLTDEELEEGCRLAANYEVATVCIKPAGVKLAASILNFSSVKVGSTVGFPHGANTTAVKVYEAHRAIDDGAVELDMVINIGKALGGDWAYVEKEIKEVVEVAHRRQTLVKIIFENSYLNEDQTVRLCEICGDAKVDYIKTSTGYATGGAKPEQLELMRKSAPPTLKLKAAGGIRSLDSALLAVKLGCDRLGVSKTAFILDELKAKLDKGKR